MRPLAQSQCEVAYEGNAKRQRCCGVGLGRGISAEKQLLILCLMGNLIEVGGQAEIERQFSTRDSSAQATAQAKAQAKLPQQVELAGRPLPRRRRRP